MCLRLGFCAASQEIGERPLGTDVTHFHEFQIEFIFHCRRHSHEAIETAGIVGSVFVLSTVVHVPSERNEIFRCYSGPKDFGVMGVTNLREK